MGVGAVEPGTVAMSIGTSGVVFAPTEGPIIEPDGRLHAFCHAVPGMWHLMGVMLSAAGSLEWFRDRITPDRSFSDLDAGASSVDPGADGLMFLPYLTGERTPHPDPLARGAFVGLTVRHGVDHMARAVLEGVAFGLRDSLELVRAVAPVDEVRVSGGGSSSKLWLQIIADAFDVPLRVVGTPEAAAHGAALLAAVGGGAFSSVGEATGTAVEVGDPVLPGSDVARYGDAYDVYRSLYPALGDAFHALGEMDD